MRRGPSENKSPLYVARLNGGRIGGWGLGQRLSVTSNNSDTGYLVPEKLAECEAFPPSLGARPALRSTQLRPMRSTLGAVAANLTLQFWNCSHENRKKRRTSPSCGVADTGSQMNDYVYAVQWSLEEKEFQVLKVPPLKHAQWGQHEYYWQAYVVAESLK